MRTCSLKALRCSSHGTCTAVARFLVATAQLASLRTNSRLARPATGYTAARTHVSSPARYRTNRSQFFHKGVDLEHYELGAYVVMPNHVHFLIRPSIAPERLMKSLKGASAREANRVLGRTGEAFWQKESLGHRGQSSEGWVGAESAGLSLVAHECVRHVRLALMRRGPAAQRRTSPPSPPAASR